MSEIITSCDDQEVHLSRGKFVNAAVVTHTNLSFHDIAFNEDRSLSCIFYGKLFGFDADLKKLEEQAHKFTRKTAGELILHAYEDRGTDAFVNLNGSFLAVISCVNSPEFLIVTDRFGTRPLYYSIMDRELIFSSQLRGVLSYPVPKREDIQTFVEFMHYGRIGLLGDKSWIEGIRLMPSASVMKFGTGGYQIQSYWDLEYVRSKQINEQAIVKSLVSTFRESVRKRVTSDVGRCCVSLSGGLDARAVIGSLDQAALHQVFAATFGEGRGTYDSIEVRLASRVCRKLGVRHVVVDEYFFDEIERYAEFVIRVGAGEATVDLIMLPYFFEKLRQAGADCFLQGYMLDLILGGSFLRRQLFTMATFSEFARFLEERSTVFTDHDLRRLLKKEFHPMITLARQHFMETVNQSKGDCFANRADYFFVATRVRRHTLVASLLYREFLEELLPTIDNDFVEVVRKIPPELRYRHRIFRKFIVALNVELAKIPYAGSLVPPILPLFLWRFGPAISKLLRLIRILSKGVVRVPVKHSYFSSFPETLRSDTNWRRMLKETLLERSGRLYKYVNREEVERLVQEHETGIRDNSEKLVELMTAKLFLASFGVTDRVRGFAEERH